MTHTMDGTTVEHPIGPNGRFELRTAAGTVDVRGVDGDVARVVEQDGHTLSERYRVETGEGSLAVVIREGGLLDGVLGFRRDYSARFAVEVPRGAVVSIVSASADLTASGLLGRLKARTASGEVELRGVAGALDLGTVSGEIVVEAAGRVDLRARTVSGDVDVRGPAFSRLEATTTSGDVAIDGLLTGPGPFSIQTVSGDAEIVGRSGLTIDARTLTGDLVSELPHHRESRPGRGSLVVGDGTTRITFQSVSGDVRVVDPRTTLPASSADPSPEAFDPTSDAPVPVASATASPNPGAIPPRVVTSGPSVDTHSSRRLEILRALERGEIDVEEAGRRLTSLEEA